MADNNITKLLTALLAPVQDLENALQDVLTLRAISTATGAQLDVIGRIVGQSRGGLSDGDYRRYIRARVAVHRSTGTPDDLIRVALLVLGLDLTSAGNVVVRTIANASFILEIRDVPVDVATATALQSMLVAAVSGGTRIEVVYSAVSLASTFRLDVGPGLDVGHLARGLDSTGAP